MKCERCERKATYHITELTGSEPRAVHLCEECAQEYLNGPTVEGEPPMVASAIAQHLGVGQTAEDLAELDQTTCPVCGITFFEFRKHGRLGCAHDYVAFEKELASLIVSIHGSSEHTGRKPMRFSDDAMEWTRLIRIRRELQEAVVEENYEEAGRLRDEIRELEAKLPKVDGPKAEPS